MATKNLTHIFMIMRDKAIQRRNMYKRDEGYSDQDALVATDEMESGRFGGVRHLPEWASCVEEVQYNISVLRDKTKKLAALQSNLIRRPSLDDNTEEEQQLATLSNEIRRSLERCQSLMLQIKHGGSSGREKTLNHNVVRALAFSLQEVKNEYTQTSSAYATSLNNIKKTSSFIHDGGGDYDSDYGTFESMSSPKHQGTLWTQEQMWMVEDNSLVVEERDKAVQNIVRSTIELNRLFRDVAQLVHEQGTVIDRIDFNVETSAFKVQDGVKQLQKAERHQRKNRNMICILGLGGTIIFLIFLLVIIKT